MQVPNKPEPCVCTQLETAERDIADAIRDRIHQYADSLDSNRSRSIALTCASLATVAGQR